MSDPKRAPLDLRGLVSDLFSAARRVPALDPYVARAERIAEAVPVVLEAGSAVSRARKAARAALPPRPPRRAPAAPREPPEPPVEVVDRDGRPVR